MSKKRQRGVAMSYRDDAKETYIVEYSSTEKFIKCYGFSITLMRPFKSMAEADSFLNNVSKSDSCNVTSRIIQIYKRKGDSLCIIRN